MRKRRQRPRQGWNMFFTPYAPFAEFPFKFDILRLVYTKLRKLESRWRVLKGFSSTWNCCWWKCLIRHAKREIDLWTLTAGTVGNTSAAVFNRFTRINGFLEIRLTTRWIRAVFYMEMKIKINEKTSNFFLSVFISTGFYIPSCKRSVNTFLQNRTLFASPARWKTNELPLILM